MLKIALWIALVFAVLFVLRLYNAAQARRRADAAREREARERRAPAAPMVRCVDCGVFLPKSDALPVGAGYRCGGSGCTVRR